MQSSTRIGIADGAPILKSLYFRYEISFGGET